MTFLTFLLYFVISMFMYQTAALLVVLGFKKYRQRKMKKMLDSGDIQMITMEEMMEQLQLQSQEQPEPKNKKGKKTWH